MSVLDRYLVARLLGVFGLTALALVAIAWANRAIRLIDRLLGDGQSALVALEFTLLALPSILRVVIPLAAFGATMILLLRLQADSELTVMKATGASPARIARGVLVFGLTIGTLSMMLVHLLGPMASARAAVRQAELAEATTAALLRDGTFATAVDGVTIYIARADPDGTLSGLLIADDRVPDDRLVYAASEAWVVRGPAGPQLVMTDGTLQRLVDGRLQMSRFDDLAYDLTPFLGSSGPPRPSLRDLPTMALVDDPAAVAEATGEHVAAVRAEATARLAEPVFVPAAALVAAAAVALARFGRLGAWQPVVGGALAIVTVNMVNTAATGAAERDLALRWLPLVPPVATLALCGLALAWAGRRP